MSSFVSENEPLESMRDLLVDNWVNYEEVQIPSIIIANDPDEAISRVNLNESDYIIISAGSGESIRMRGNWSYYDKTFELVLNILTKESRQRLRNIYKVIRSICFINKWNFPNWQLVRLIRYREYTNTDINIWRSEILVNLENNAILAETSV
jgi:predicted phosphohydrolase